MWGPVSPEAELDHATEAPKPEPEVEIRLEPLTPQEQALDLRVVLANQPDFVADQGFSYWEGFGGFTGQERIARKGRRTRVETGAVTLIIEPGKPSIELLAAKKQYFSRESHGDGEPGSGRPIDPVWLLGQEGLTLTALGAKVIDGHRCIKIEAKASTIRPKIYLYSAVDLKYLIVAADVIDPPCRSRQVLSNVSLDVPAGLVEVPADYSEIPKIRWERVETASVLYAGKPARGASVFRSTNGTLYVVVEERHPVTGLLMPWHYIVRVEDRTAEVAYMGTLITADGSFVWQTEAREAFSIHEGSAPGHRLAPCKGPKCPPVVVTPGYVEFPSVEYEKTKAVVRVVGNFAKARRPRARTGQPCRPRPRPSRRLG